MKPETQRASDEDTKVKPEGNLDLNKTQETWV